MKNFFLTLLLVLNFTIVLNSCSNGNSNGNGNTTEQLAQGETYSCTMHPEVMSEKPGNCPKCKMNLVKQKMTDEQIKMKESGNYVKPE